MKLRAKTLCVVCLTPLLVLGCAMADDGERRTGVAWEATPRLTLGVPFGDPAVEFGNVVAAAKLSDGRLAIADYTHGEVRLFTQNGQHIESIGGRGEGPGEFPALVRLTRTAGDTLVAGGMTRLSIFTPSGEHARDLRPTWEGVAASPWRLETVWPLSKDLFLAKLISGRATDAASDGIGRPPELYVVTRGDTLIVDTLGVFGGLEQLQYDVGGRKSTAVPLFAAYTYPALADGYVAIGDTDADSVLVYRTSTGVQAWVPVPMAPKAVSEEAWEKAKDVACRESPDPERCRRDFLNLPVESETTVFAGLAIDSLGTLWLKAPNAEPDTLAEWLVVDVEGQPQGRVLLPADARIAQVGLDYVVAIRMDSLGVRRVVEYSLSK